MDAFFKEDKDFAGTKGLVFIGDKVLVYRRDQKAPRYPLHLDVPGGGAEPNETPFDTFRREVKEEFDLDISPDQIVYSRRYQGKINGWYAVAMLPQEAQQEIIFGNEGLGYSLMTLNEFLERDDAWPAYQERAIDYINSLEKSLSQP